MLQGFLIFALHRMRNTQVRKKKSNWLLTPQHQFFSVSIDIWVLELKPYFVLLVYLQIKERFKRKILFSIFYKEQLHKEELTGQSKYVWAVELQFFTEFESKSRLT